MRTIGVYLIFAAVVVRGLVISMEEPNLSLVSGLLTAYGLFLFAKSWFIRYRTLFESRYAQLTYLLLQSFIAIGLLIVSSYGDVFALLFIPLSLDAVSFFGRRVGYLCITVFSLALTIALLSSEEGLPFALTMGVFFSGLCFLFGGYASQVQKAEAAHDQNQRAFNELQTAHRQLQGYADQVASLAVEHERSRLARDLHDSVTQTVFSMNLTTQSAYLLLDQDSARTSGQLLRLEELAANALSEIQSLILQLKPRSITEEGLAAALRRLANEHCSRNGLNVSLEIHGEKPLSESAILGLYSITHEALTNINKHSGVKEAKLHLNLSDDRSCLEIEDHGRGFDPQAAVNQRGHFGLAGMSERAQDIGWRLSVESRPHQGTRIRVTQNQAGGSR